MSLFFSTLLSYILIYKYVGLFVVTLLASFALPLPSATTLVAMSIFAATGYVNFFWTIVIALVGNVLGDLLSYFLARIYGKKVFELLGLKKLLTHPYLLESEKYLKKHTGATIFFTRFITTAGPIVNILAGLSKMDFRKYFLFEFVGEFADTMIFALIGYYFGNQWENLGSTATFIEVGVVAFGIIVYWFIVSIIKRSRK